MQNFPRNSLTAIVIPTHECNLACQYCYDAGVACAEPYMSEATLQKVINSLVEYHGTHNTIHIIWHGGEPLLMGLDFYRRAVAYQEAWGVEYRFDNVMQTNATLLTDEMIDFFYAQDFNIGTSLDGPAVIHNFQRPYKDGYGSFDDVMRALTRLREMGSKQLLNKKSRYMGKGGIAILTKYTIDHLDEFYLFFRDNHLSPKINPLFYVGRARENRQRLGITASEYKEAMLNLFERWIQQGDPGFVINPFDTIIGNLVTGVPEGCLFQPSCLDQFISIMPNGDVFPCGRWGAEKDFCIGNICEDALAEILNSKVQIRLREERALALKLCSACKYHNICNAGCMNNSFMKRGIITDKDYYCSGYRALYERVEEFVSLELKSTKSSV